MCKFQKDTRHRLSGLKSNVQLLLYLVYRYLLTAVFVKRRIYVNGQLGGVLKAESSVLNVITFEVNHFSTFAVLVVIIVLLVSNSRNFISPSMSF